jgi:GNAT superfamily N-acetyltransferase
MQIRDYYRSDALAITQLFYKTVHTVNVKDYSEKQVEAWVPAVPDVEVWHSRMIERTTLVAEEGDQILAFAELESDGHLDMFYCRHDVIGRGVGRSLYQAIERRALGMDLGRIFTEASITARPFFERRGFTVVQEQTVTRGGVEMRNFRMEKLLSHSF